MTVLLSNLRETIIAPNPRTRTHSKMRRRIEAFEGLVVSDPRPQPTGWKHYLTEQASPSTARLVQEKKRDLRSSNAPTTYTSMSTAARVDGTPPFRVLTEGGQNTDLPQGTYEYVLSECKNLRKVHRTYYQVL